MWPWFQAVSAGQRRLPLTSISRKGRFNELEFILMVTIYIPEMWTSMLAEDLRDLFNSDQIQIYVHFILSCSGFYFEHKNQSSILMQIKCKYLWLTNMSQWTTFWRMKSNRNRNLHKNPRDWATYFQSPYSNNVLLCSPDLLIKSSNFI